MELKRVTMSFVLIGLMGLIRACEGCQFYVGGKDGWVLKPSEDYNHWAQRNRFQVNDTLFFKYKKGSDSVLQVAKEDYFSCNTKNPLLSLTEGDSIFMFNNSGPFYFISGNCDHCNNGQKLVTIVLAVRDKTGVPPSPAPVTTITSPPSPTPEAETLEGKSPESDLPPKADIYAPPPAPAPASNSGSNQFAYFGLVLGVSFGVTVVLGSFIS